MPQRGTTQPVSATFYDGPGGAVTDPTSLTLTFRFDDVLVYTAPPGEIIRDSEGNYHFDWNIPIDAEPGQWIAVWGALMPGDSLTSYGYETIQVTAFPAGLPGYNGCDWPIDPACLSETWDTYDDEIRQRAVSLASATLYRLCGYRVGGCPLTVRPSRENGLCHSNGGEFFGAGFTPVNWNGQWTNVGHLDSTDARLVDLPAPIGEIIEVKVDGLALDPTDYSVVDNRYLAWTGGGQAPWPLTQDWVTPDTEEGTFSVTYLNAYPVDSLGAYAAGLLAMEFAKACAGGGKACRLPSNVISIVRQGVSYEMSAGAFPDGKTNIREVDAYIEQWNPKGRKSAGMVFNPGRPKVHVTR